MKTRTSQPTADFDLSLLTEELRAITQRTHKKRSRDRALRHALQALRPLLRALFCQVRAIRQALPDTGDPELNDELAALVDALITATAEAGYHGR